MTTKIMITTERRLMVIKSHVTPVLGTGSTCIPVLGTGSTQVTVLAISIT